jgi:hypothetical protein
MTHVATAVTATTNTAAQATAITMLLLTTTRPQ